MILARIRGAWALTDPDLAKQRLERLASELDRTWPDAADSLREGLDDTLTLMRLGIGGQLAKTLCSTNPCESMVRHEAPCETRKRTNNSHPCRLGCRHGLMRRPGEAGGSHGVGSDAGGGSSPDKRSGGAGLPDARVRATKPERQSESEAVAEAP